MTTHSIHGMIYEFGLADRLRAARESAKYTVRDFELRTGISKSSIGNYESGKTRPRKPQIAMWALATGFDAGWLETGKAPAQPEPDGGLRIARSEGLEPPTFWLVDAA